MKEVIKLNQEKYIELQRKIYGIAKAHGWHEQPLSPQHYCGLIMTEVAEIVEADRNGRRAQTTHFEALLSDNKPESKTQKAVFRMWYMRAYNEYIKGSIEEEFADVVIRLLDMAQDIYGDKMKWGVGATSVFRYVNEGMSVVVNALYFIRGVLNVRMNEICDSVTFMHEWAHHLGIDLDKHIEWKMKYNEFRSYKHGGKKY